MTHLVTPLPLERHRHLQQDGYDPREVDITHYLQMEGGMEEGEMEGGREKERDYPS